MTGDRTGGMRGALAGDGPVEAQVAVQGRIGGGFRPVERFAVTHVDPDGARVGPLARDILRCGTVVCVIPHDPGRDALVMIRQFRPAAHLATGRGLLLELPAGGVDGDETPADAAARELREETGLQALALVPAFRFMPSPGLMDEYAHVFVATVDAGALPAQAGLLEGEGERTHPLAVPVAEAARLLDGEEALLNGFTRLGLHWFLRRRAAGAAGAAPAGPPLRGQDAAS